MKYYYTEENGRPEYVVTEGTAYIAFVVMGGCGFRIDEVKAGDSWFEGVGEEFVIAKPTYQEADDYIRETYFSH